ncbi:aminopeptidase P family protein [Marivibrio halodurans]|uniref:Aminopeptidase P family protein n=1 Tax=Marivibrio halodurans TaxID=2039722 RepID=A0A8J7SPG4_9PROT|nr:Xaa-Pro peptidase family protein [Marivibrio halodurans]MBP5858618.1 aminopeptidase P family protein [Marivibrio halodurans]
MLVDPFVVGSARKIDPYRRRIANGDLLPDGTPNDGDRVEIGPTDLAFEEWAALDLTPPDMPRLRAYRLSRLLGELQRRDIGGLLMFDPLNIRYATDTTNMQLWIAHNPCRAALVTADGAVTLWDFHGGDHLSAHLPLVTDLRHGASFFYFESGSRTEEHAARFAGEVDGILRNRVGSNRRLAVDKIEIAGLRALEARGISVHPGQELTEHARRIKDDNELNAMRCAIASCEAAMAEMRVAVRPGMTEVEAWAILQHGNHIRGGEWIETRILASGPRTNPWFQECGPRIMRDGDILAFDTDLIGPYGYCADLSRTWKIGETPPTAYEKDIYKAAHDHIRENMALLAPGRSFRELMEKGQRLPEKFRAQRYGVMFHGVGLCDEYPSLRYPEDYDACGYDGVLEPGMCLCVEVYLGELGGPCGIKLEDQGVITEQGFDNLTRFPFESTFLDA